MELKTGIRMARRVSTFRNGPSEKKKRSLNMCDFGFEPWTSPIKGFYHLLTLSKAASDWPTRVVDERKRKEKIYIFFITIFENLYNFQNF